MTVETAAALSPGAASCPQLDAAISHPWAFVFMAILAVGFAVARVATETKISVARWKSFLHLWMATYLILLLILMSVTTAMSLVLLVDGCGHLRTGFVPPSFVSMAAAVLGVFGFEFLVRKFIVGFGETQLDIGTTLQNLVDQRVAATLKKEAG